MKRNHLSMIGVLMMTLILTACGGKEDESQIRDAVEEVVTKNFKIYEHYCPGVEWSKRVNWLI